MFSTLNFTSALKTFGIHLAKIFLENLHLHNCKKSESRCLALRIKSSK